MAPAPPPANRKPVWIKYYGIPMTRRGYLLALGAAGLFALTVVVVAAALGKLPPLESLWVPALLKQPGPGPWLLNNLYRIIALCLVAEALDTFVVLRRFARQEAEERARESMEPSSPPLPSSEAIRTDILER